MSRVEHASSATTNSGHSTDSDLDWAVTTGALGPRTRSPGTTVGEYIILQQLGAGGMGVVYAAYDPKLDRKVALKVLRGVSGDEHESVARARMLAEGRALARVNHRNVVTVFDVGSIEGEVYVAMELVEGQTLKGWRKGTPRSWEETVSMFVGIAAGLGAVHDAGLVHRDVKPDNVLIDDRDGEPRVTDFGLARAHDATQSLEAAERELVPRPETSPVELTQTGVRLGTPAYMASEQLRGGAATTKSDQFSLCASLWECLYGVRPYKGDSWVSLMVAMGAGELREPASTPSGRPVPAWLRRIVLRGLSIEPEDRWPSIAMLAEALSQGDPNKTKRRVWGGLGAGVLALAVAGGVQVQRDAAQERALAACEDSGAAIDTSWTGETREELRAGFMATTVVNADAIAGEVVATFDVFAQTWAQERSAACVAGLPESTPLPPLVERRIECLQERRHTFETLVDAFVHPDDVTVKRALRTAEGLADVKRCQDEQWLAKTPPLPKDPEVHEQVRALYVQLAGTLVHEHVGRYDEGQTLAENALGRAISTEHRPLIANAHYRVAVFFEKRGEYEHAVASWVEAFREATLGGDEQLAAQAATALAFTEGYQLERHGTGIRWAELAGVYLERLGMTQTLTEATRLDALAVLHDVKGDYETSIATHRQALALRRELVPPDHYSIGYGLTNLAAVLRGSGQLEPAKKALLESKAILEVAFGPSNPTTAHVLHNLAGVESELGNYAEAEVLLDRVESIWSASLGPEHPDLGDVHNSVGEILCEQGRFEDAQERHRRALAIHRKSLHEDHPDIARSANKLGQAQWLAGHVDAAESSFRLALQTTRKADIGQRDDVGRARHGLALIALERGDAERASELFSLARSDFEAHGDGHARWVGRTRVGSAAARFIAGDGEHAMPLLAELMDDESLPGSVRAEASAWHARALGESGDEARAEQDRERAVGLVADATADVRARIAGIVQG